MPAVEPRVREVGLAARVDAPRAAPRCARPRPRAGSRRPRTGAARRSPSRARRAPSPRTARPAARARGSCACSPARPKQRSTAHSLSARKRRPSAGPYSLRFVTPSAADVRRYSGVSAKAARRSSGRAVNRHEQSTGVNSHLCGLTTSESARSKPGVRELRADARRAGVGGVDVQPRSRGLGGSRRSPARDRPTSSRSCRRSRRPRRRRSDRARRRACGRRRRPATWRISRPRMRAARSTEECACSEATTTRRSGSARARRAERRERRDRRRVLDVAVPLGGQAEQLAEPRERQLLELGDCRRGAPEHPVGVQRGGQQLREDARAPRP